jgi:VCBS repeat-containing protein
MVICGINHTNIAQLPKQAYSSLSGTLITAHGTFTSAFVASGGSSVVLGNWSSVSMASGGGSGKSVVARVGGTWSSRTSPLIIFSGYTLDNVGPVANDDPSYGTDEDTPLNASSVLANDTDANNDTLTAVLDSGPSNASSFTLNGDGTFSYTPNADYNGTDSFTYHANDGSLDSNSATVTITVNSVNDAPVATDDPSYSTDEDTPLTASSSVLTNDSDADNDTLTAVLDSGPSNALSFTLNSDGTFSYTPNADYNGTDSFTYHANDGALDSGSATVTITINAVNDAPTASNDSLSMTQDTTANISAANGLLTDAADVDSGSLTAVLVTGPSHALSFNLNSDGSFSYQPQSGYTGTDSFTWKANDGSLDSSPATLNITVNSSGGGGGGGGGGGCLIVC